MNNLSKIYIINLIIIVVWSTFILLNWITFNRLIIFLIILSWIWIYRFIINKLEKSLFIINNDIIIRLIIFINKCKNPLLLLLIKLDCLMYDLIIVYNNKLLNNIINLIFIILFNPIKIFYFKMYKVLWIWKDRKMHNIIIVRMLGLILSILIFTDFIIYIKFILQINIFMIIYLYLLVISILCEIIKTRESKLLNIFLVNNINTKSVILNRLEVNLLSIILIKNNINELNLYINNDIKSKVEVFQIGHMFYIVNSLIYLKYKPNYWFYFNLRSILDIYILRIEHYIFFEYYNWDVPNINIIKELMDVKNLHILKEIYEYDYKVFKTLLFLYWDIEYYLDNMDYVKSSLNVCSDDLDFLRIKIENELKSEIVFLENIKYKAPNQFWVVIDSVYESIFKFDLFNKLSEFNYSNFKNDYIDIAISQNYVKFNISYSNICTLIEVQSVDKKINPLYYHSYIEKWYEEWKSEISLDLTLKYKEKIKILDNELKKLIKILNEMQV